MSTTYGFILKRRPRTTAGGGGGGGATYDWKRDTSAQTVAWVSGGLEILLTETPVSAASILVLSQTTPIQPGDYTYLTSPARIRIDFAADPVTETDSGTWNFIVQYPYEV